MPECRAPIARCMYADVPMQCVRSIDGHEVHVTKSIGVSVYPGDGADAESLIRNADAAMYLAKEGGRQGYRFFEAAMPTADAVP